MATETRPTVLAARGGSFLIEDRLPEEVFTPEDFSDEQRMIGDTAQQFMENEMVPRLGEILLDIQPPKRSDKARPEITAA